MLCYLIYLQLVQAHRQNCTWEKRKWHKLISKHRKMSDFMYMHLQPFLQGSHHLENSMTIPKLSIVKTEHFYTPKLYYIVFDE